MSDEHPRNFNQNRKWLESISTPETRRAGGLAAAHDLGKRHEAAGCPRCEDTKIITLDNCEHP
jgi:hypothetical protein